MTVVSDSFPYAGTNPLPAPWVHESNSIYKYAGGFWPGDGPGAAGLANALNIARYGGSGIGAPQQAQIVLLGVGAGIPDWIGPMVRCQAGAASGYAFAAGTVSSKIIKIAAGVETVLLGGGPAVAATDTLLLVVNGTTLTAYINGAAVLTTTDGTYAAGDPGLYAVGIVIGVNSWTAQDIVTTVVITDALAQRTRCVPRSSREMVEARITTGADIRQRADQWAACDGGPSSDLEILADGGIRLKATAGAAVGPSGLTGGGYFQDYPRFATPPFINLANPRVGMEITWSTAGAAYGSIQAYLNPHVDPTKGPTVFKWILKLYRLATRSGQLFLSTGTFTYLVPVLTLTKLVDNNNAGWVIFPFTDNNGKPTPFLPDAYVPPAFTGLTNPAAGPNITNEYVVLIRGYDAQGSSATNIGWGFDNSLQTLGVGNVLFKGIQFDPLQNGFGLPGDIQFSGPAQLGALQLIPVSHAATAVITFKSGTPIDLGPPNLLDQYDYEVDIVGAAGAGPVTLSRDNAHAVKGAWALKVVTTAAAGVQGVHTLNRSGAGPRAVAGASYTYEAWVFADGSSTGKTWRIGIDWYTIAAVFVSTSSASFVLAAGWNRLTVTATCPATGAGADVYVDENASVVQTIWVDDVRFSLAGVPATPPELLLQGELPSGTTMVGEVAADPAGGFVTYVDGQATSYAGPPPSGYTNLGLATQNRYDLRVTLTSSPDGSRTPILRAVGAEIVVGVDLGDVAEVTSWQERIDPQTHIAEVGECTIRAIHDGERDFRSAIARLLSENPPGLFYFRIRAGDRAIPKSQWLHLQDFLVDDTDPRGPDVGITCVSPLALLRQALPKLSSDASGVPILDYLNGGAWITSTGQAIVAGTGRTGSDLIADVATASTVGYPKDKTYIESPVNPTNAQYVATLSPVGTPAGAILGQVVIQARAALGAGATCSLKLELLEGVTVRATLGSVPITNTDTGVEGNFAPVASYALKPNEISAIGDWSNLFLRFSATGVGGAKVRVGWARLVILGTRSPLQYPSSATPATTVQGVIDDLITSQVALIARYRGPTYVDITPALPVAKTIATDPGGETDLTRAKQELDWLAWIAGIAFTSYQGRIACTPLYQVTAARDPVSATPAPTFEPLAGPVPISRTLPIEEIEPISTAPGWRQRVGVYNVAFGWDPNAGVYAGEAQITNFQAIANFPPALVDPESRAPAGISQWLESDGGVARALAIRHSNAFALGCMEWRFRTTYARPEWKLGDVITFAVDRFLAFDPIATRAIRGPNWVTGVLVGKWDAMGHEWSVWVQSYANMVPIATSSPVALPSAVSSDLVRNGDFENGLAYWGVGFAGQSGLSVFPNRTFPTPAAFRGSGSLRITMGPFQTVRALQCTGSAPDSSQDIASPRYIAVIPGDTYRIHGAAFDTFLGWVGVREYDAAFVQSGETLSLAWNTGTGVWIEKDGTYTVPAGVYYVAVMLKCQNVGGTTVGDTFDEIHFWHRP